MNIAVVEECSKLSEEEKITFPEVVMRLSRAGIESYSVNMLVPNKIFYSGNETHEVLLNLKTDLKVADIFNQDNVIAAIRASQECRIGYQEFLKKIMEAGVIFYMAFLQGRKVIYFGRNGEQHCEYFPS